MSASETTLVSDIEVTNRAGIHTRVALMIFKKSEHFSAFASITNKNTGHTADCRSVLELLSLGAACGDKIVLSVIGSDAEMLQKELLTLFECNFYEDEAEAEETKSP
ncbi:MAG: HPr family phosphocarrier protein [Planctomycetaceae bacterium]|nr:HPr family phosphocarrier protein [Planctomycetaceae bacterium]